LVDARNAANVNVPDGPDGHPAAIGLEMEVAMEWKNERLCDWNPAGRRSGGANRIVPR
jgi:hypothetical protein